MKLQLTTNTSLQKFIWLLAILFMLFPGGQAAACSPIGPIGRIVCTPKEELIQVEEFCINDNCSLKVAPYADEYNEWEIEQVTHEFWQNEFPMGYFTQTEFYFLQFENLNFSLINTFCQEDFEVYASEFDEQYREWLTVPIPGEFVIEPYSEEREKEFIEDQTQLIDCSTTTYTHVDDWLISFEDIKEYCYVGYDGSSCESIRINPIAFLGYLLKNPNQATLPYLISGIVIAVLLIVIVMGIRNRFNSKS